MFSTMIALSLAVMATLADTATATPITASGGNLTPARAALASGRFTYYTPGLGACGVTNSEAELVVALSYVDFDPYTPAETRTTTRSAARSCAHRTTARASMSLWPTAALRAPRVAWT